MPKILNDAEIEAIAEEFDTWGMLEDGMSRGLVDNDVENLIHTIREERKQSALDKQIYKERFDLLKMCYKKIANLEKQKARIVEAGNKMADYCLMVSRSIHRAVPKCDISVYENWQEAIEDPRGLPRTRAKGGDEK